MLNVLAQYSDGPPDWISTSSQKYFYLDIPRSALELFKNITGPDTFERYFERMKLPAEAPAEKLGEIMKFANVVNVILGAVGVVIMLGLAGCSDAPSDGDVKQALQKMTGDCKYFAITHVMKVNWALPGTTDYQVDVQYSIQAAPLPDAKNIAGALTAPLSALQARMTVAGAERDRDFKANADFLDHIERAQHIGDESLARSYERQRSIFVAQKLEPSMKLSRELAVEKVTAIKQGTLPLRDAFFKACPKTSPAVYQQVFGNADIAQYVEGHTMDLATSIRMIKIITGWQLSE